MQTPDFDSVLRHEDDKLYWKVNRGRAKAGEEAGCLDKRDGYYRIGVFGKQYLLHVLIWYMDKGVWPTGQLDNIDLDKSNNRPSNLRDVTQNVNQWNCVKRRHNISGFLGVSCHRRSGKWQASIAEYGKQRYLGLFNSPEEAAKAYLNAKEVRDADTKRTRINHGADR